MIRKFKPEDETIVLTMWVKANFRANSFIQRDFWIQEFNDMKDKVINYDTYIYEESGEVKGFITIYKKEKILAIVVKQEYLKNGIGRKLINYCKERNDCLSINVYENNVEAVVFILRMEFKNMGVKIDNKTNEKQYIMNWIK